MQMYCYLELQTLNVVNNQNSSQCCQMNDHFSNSSDSVHGLDLFTLFFTCIQSTVQSHTKGLIKVQFTLIKTTHSYFTILNQVQSQKISSLSTESFLVSHSYSNKLHLQQNVSVFGLTLCHLNLTLLLALFHRDSLRVTGRGE